MNKQQIIQTVKQLNLPKGSYIVYGSCPLAAAGIREAGDIDLLVTAEVIDSFKKAGWQQIDKGHPNDMPYVNGDVEAHDNWNFSSYQPTLVQLLKTADMYDGVPFASLDDVLKWKQASGRPKDLTDVELIQDYLAAH